MALVWFAIARRALSVGTLMDVLRDTMAVTGALFALLIGATVFTLVLRAFGTDRWVSSLLAPTAASSMYGPLLVVMLMLALCAFVLDAFEMTFVLRHSCGYPSLTVAPMCAPCSNTWGMPRSTTPLFTRAWMLHASIGCGKTDPHNG